MLIAAKKSLINGAQLPGRNLLRASEDFTNSGFWTASGATPLDDVINGPFGNADASSIQITGACFIRQSFTVVPGQNLTASFYIKRNDHTALTYDFFIYNETGAAAIIANQNFFIESSISEWLRIVRRFQVPAGCTTARIYVASGSNLGTFYAWGAQVVLGNNPLQYQKVS